MHAFTSLYRPPCSILQRKMNYFRGYFRETKKPTLKLELLELRATLLHPCNLPDAIRPRIRHINVPCPIHRHTARIAELQASVTLAESDFAFTQVHQRGHKVIY